MVQPINFFDLSKISADERAQLLIRSEEKLEAFLDGARPIIDAVRQEGDAALARFAQKFDKSTVTNETLKASEAEFEAAFQAVDQDIIDSIHYAVENIRRFHERQKPDSMWLDEIRPGLFCGEKTTPIPSVACYVPRGKGSFPSVVMMTTVPAVVAGVPRIVIITPPGPEGSVDPATLVAARIVGVQDVYKCGGAQGVAAVAFGTETVPRCHKIVGPGSPWVVAAKQILAGQIDPGLPAGPSESIVLADGSADPQIAALDLLIEAEHGPDSSAYLVTDSREVAEQALAAIPNFYAQMTPERVKFVETVLSGPCGGIVLAPNMTEALSFVNDYAPEHLEVLSDSPMQYLSEITNASEILLGDNTPFVLGNFVLGPNAVLPTSGFSKTWSPLSVFDYVKRSSIAHVTDPAYRELAFHAERLARYEGFDAHANAISQTRDKIKTRNRP